MPQRTNSFQQLMHYIYSQLAPMGATVKESATLSDQNGGGRAEREIDILVEHEILGTRIRMAIECRDRVRRDDVTWIDGLIGKYSRLDVQKVIAISSSGFSEEARRKAAEHNIDIRALNDALIANWPEEIIKLGMIGVKQESNVLKIEIELDPRLGTLPTLTTPVLNDNSQPLGTLESQLQRCLHEAALPSLQSQIKENFLQLFKAVEDFNKPLRSEQRITVQNLWLEGKGRTRHRITRLVFRLRTDFSVVEVPVKRQIFETAYITSGMLSFPGSDDKIKMSAVQILDRDEGKLFIWPAEK